MIILSRLVIFLVLGLYHLNAFAKTSFVTIGTGAVTGVYYPTGGALAKLINQERSKYGIRMSVESTAGSVYNINAVLNGDLQFGLSQSDRQFQAVNGLAEWKEAGKQGDLRAICSLHPESITLVAAVDADINEVKDLKGKRVNLAEPGSGIRNNAIDVLGLAGLDWQKDLKAESLKVAEAPSMLQDGRIDAFFYTVGHPSGAIQQATAGKRKVKLIPLSDELISELIRKYPFMVKATINHQLYPMAENKQNTQTVGLAATLVSSTKVPEEIVYATTKVLFENLDTFRSMHEALKFLDEKAMISGHSAPLHPGAEKFFKEKKLIP
jgi:TRAP transporter TAXI family solute receptor